jgi:hypothetical protein
MPRPGLPLVHFHDTCCGSVAELRSIILKARRLAADHAEQERAAAAVKTSGEPNAMSPDLSESKPFCSPQDQIQWSILFLGRHLRRSSPWEREECLQDVWEWGRQRGDLLCLQIIRDYRECYKQSGPTYRRHQKWFLSR